MRKTALGVCLLTALSLPAFAAKPDAGHPSIESLAARIQALETNAEQLRKQAADALAAAHAAQAALQKMQADKAQAEQEAALAAVTNPAPTTQASGIGTGNDFNPAIAVILNGTYAHHSLDQGRYLLAGDPPAGPSGPVPQGLSLGESEIALAANIDDKFYGQLTVTAANENGADHVGVEEAFIDTTALPAGFGVRAGRFYSDIGYLNSHHAHTDFFSVRPLAYQAFLGDQYGDDGVRAQWVAPTSIFLQLGGELFRGANYPTAGAGHGNGTGAYTAFVHAGGDVGPSNAWFAGLSTLHARTREADDGFSGDNTLYIADGTWKWSRHGNFKDGGLLLRSEYLVDKRDGRYDPAIALAHTDTDDDPAVNMLAQPWTGTRRGMYIEGVYNFDRTWSAGYRYDKLWTSDLGPYGSTFDPYRHSMMLTWRNSEFSLLRLQLSHEKPNQGATDNAVVLQYQVEMGAHGAHKF